jgi:hypothetical protein
MKQLPKSILNYFATFTETKFRFRKALDYKWTNSEFTLDVPIFQDFQQMIIDKIKDGKLDDIKIKEGEYISLISVDSIKNGVTGILNGDFSVDYLKKCVESSKNCYKK